MKTILLAALSSFSLWSILVSSVLGQSGPTAEFSAKAKEEGEVVFYCSLNLNDAEALRVKFQEKYPFLQVKLNRRGREILTAVLTEARTGKYSADIIQTNVFGMHTIKKSGLLGYYLSPEDRLYPKEFKDQGYWTTFNVNLYPLTYNTKLVAPEQIPKSYEDLLKPLWKGKMMMDPENAPWFATMLQIMGKDKGLEYMKALAKQNIMLRQESSAMTAQLIASGEAALHLNMAAGAVDQLRKRGAPIDWTTVGPAPVTPSAVGIVARAPHPNAAKLFLDFVLSREMQRLVMTLGRAIVRSDLLQEQATVIKKGLQMVPADPALAENLADYSRKFRDIFSK